MGDFISRVGGWVAKQRLQAATLAVAQTQCPTRNEFVSCGVCGDAEISGVISEISSPALSEFRLPEIIVSIGP